MNLACAILTITLSMSAGAPGAAREAGSNDTPDGLHTITADELKGLIVPRTIIVPDVARAHGSPQNIEAFLDDGVYKHVFHRGGASGTYNFEENRICTTTGRGDKVVHKCRHIYQSPRDGLYFIETGAPDDPRPIVIEPAPADDSYLPP